VPTSPEIRALEIWSVRLSRQRNNHMYILMNHWIATNTTGSYCLSKIVKRVVSHIIFTVRKIWRTSSLSISRPGDLDLWPWIWGALLLMGCTIFLPILVFLGRFVFDLSAYTCRTHHMTLRPWPLTLKDTALVADAGLHAASVYQVWSS